MSSTEIINDDGARIDTRIEVVDVLNRLKNQWVEFHESEKPYWVMKHQVIGFCENNQEAEEGKIK